MIEQMRRSGKGNHCEMALCRPPKVVNGLKIVKSKKNMLCINPVYINASKNTSQSSMNGSGIWWTSYSAGTVVHLRWQIRLLAVAIAPGHVAVHEHCMKEQIHGLTHGGLWDQCDSMDVLHSQAGGLLGVPGQMTGKNKLSCSRTQQSQSLGTVLNIPDPPGRKAIWVPKIRVRLLSMLKDSAQEYFLLPEDKQLDSWP
ncbi:TPA: hypothetical protein ACH3X3_004898 [Trebouxia sp. C0006]